MARLLLIDDERDYRELLNDHLQQHGHEVVSLELAEDGLERLVRERFDVVLLDNRMPAMSGLEFLAAAKRRGSSVPVILMTAAHLDQTVIQAMNLGAFAYVIKPLDERDLSAEFDPVIR